MTNSPQLPLEGDDPVGRWGRESQLYAAYTGRASELLDAEEAFRTARAEWESFFRTSHGDVLDDVDGDRSRADLFVDTLYVDFVVDRLIGCLERQLEFSLVNPEPRTNTDALTFSFRELHEAVVETGPVADELDATIVTDDVLAAETEFLRTLYEGIVPRELRLQLGEYYTPRGVAQLAVDALGSPGVVEESVLDPGCGSGIFLAECIDRKRAAMAESHEPAPVVERITSTVIGMDLNPVAVKSAKLASLLALAPALEAADHLRVELPVFLTDSLALTRDDTIQFRGRAYEPTVDTLVGNPPWITWDRLPDSVKDRWRERHVDELDLLPHEGASSRLGYANDDVSIPFVWVCVHRYLASGGRVSVVLKRDVMTGPAGRVLRSGSVGDRPIAMTHVHDFATLQPFGDQVGANAAIYTFTADAEPAFPIETTAWATGDGSPSFTSQAAMRERLSRESTGLVPVEDDDSTSAWLRTDAERRALGDCEQSIRHGVKDDAQAVFSIDRDQLATLEPDHVYPYVKSRHVVKYGLFGHELRLVPLEKANESNEAELEANSPQTYAYLDAHRERLEARASSWLEQGPFYTLFGLGEYTWADYKVVWCRLGFKPHFAVVSTVEEPDLGEKSVVPGDHYMFVPTDDEREAHFLCALLNSAVYQRSLTDLASEGKSSLSKSVVSQLRLPAWTGTDLQRRLAERSMTAHDIVADFLDDHREPGSTTPTISKRAYNATTIPELEEVQAEIDRLVETLLVED